MHLQDGSLQMFFGLRRLRHGILRMFFGGRQLRRGGLQLPCPRLQLLFGARQLQDGVPQPPRGVPRLFTGPLKSDGRSQRFGA